MAEAKETTTTEVEAPKRTFTMTDEEGKSIEHNVDNFTDQGKFAYGKLMSLVKQRDELQSAITDVNILINSYRQAIVESDINPPVENGEDKNPMEEAVEIADEEEKTSHQILEETGVEPVMKKKKDS